MTSKSPYGRLGRLAYRPLFCLKYFVLFAKFASHTLEFVNSSSPTVMETDPLEILLPIITTLANLISHSCLELVAEEMSQGSRTPNVSWSRPEEHDLLSFLIRQKLDGRMGDGTFRHSTWTAAAHMAVVTQPPPATIKTAKSCKGKYGTVSNRYDPSQSIDYHQTSLRLPTGSSMSGAGCQECTGITKMAQTSLGPMLKRCGLIS